jgi:peroxiredoxin
LAGFEEKKDELTALGVSVVAGSVDPIDKAREVAAALSFPMAYGVLRQTADLFGAWWEDRRSIIQPSEFLIGKDGRIVASSYSAGPLGRFTAMDVISLVKFHEARKQAGT